MENRVIPLTKMRRIVGDRMCASLAQTAQYTLTREIDVDALMDYIHEKRSSKAPVKLMPVLIKVIASLLTEHERLNSSIKDDNVVYHDRVNVGVAVALKDDGILVPVVFNADTRSVNEIMEVYDDLIPRAKTGRLRSTEMSGGTFTISNLGMVGIDGFTPIVNYPEAAILGIGRINVRLYMDGGGALKQKKTIVFSLSTDHRLVDGYIGALFLESLSSTISDIGKLRAAVE